MPRFTSFARTSAAFTALTTASGWSALSLSAADSPCVFALHRGQHCVCIEHRPIDLVRIHAPPPPAAQRSTRPIDSVLRECTYAGEPWRGAAPVLSFPRPMLLLRLRQHTARLKGPLPPSFSTRREASLDPDYQHVR